MVIRRYKSIHNKEYFDRDKECNYKEYMRTNPYYFEEMFDEIFSEERLQQTIEELKKEGIITR